MDNDINTILYKLVLDKFEFLITEYGFKIYRDNEWRFIAESSFCRVIMDYDKGLFDCWIERLYDKNMEKDLYPIINVQVIACCLGYIKPEFETQFIAKKDSVTKEIIEYSYLLNEYCANFLRGDFSKWAQVVSCVQIKSENLENQDNIIKQKNLVKAFREKAQAAWIVKDFEKVIEDYNHIFDLLTPTEKMRFEYSKKHMKNLDNKA
jgi:hypothetical protein